MGSTEYNPEKKALPVTAIILSIIGFIGAIVYFILNACTTLFTSTSGIVFICIFGAFLIAGIICAGIAKAKKLGSKKLTTNAEMIALIAILIFVALNVISMLFK